MFRFLFEVLYFKPGITKISLNLEIIFQLKAKFFENGEEDKDLVKEEEEKLRKESFQKAKVIFQENPGKEDESEENGSLENGDDENEDELDTTETDQARRKAEFEAKQKLFSSQ